MRLQHRGQVLYRDSLQAAIFNNSCSVFVRFASYTCGSIDHPCIIFCGTAYGLQSPVLPLQFVPVPPPSARAGVGVTKVLRNRTAVARTNRTRFTVVFSFVNASGP